MSRIRVDKNKRKYIIKLLQNGDFIMKKIVSFIIILILLLPFAAVAENGAVVYSPNAEISANISGAESAEEQSKADIYGDASGFDRFMIGFMFVILSFSALCMPIYVFLDFKKKREKRKDADKQEDDGEGEQ